MSVSELWQAAFVFFVTVSFGFILVEYVHELHFHEIQPRTEQNLSTGLESRRAV